MAHNRVRELREEQGMSQEELARRAKVSLRTVEHVERGLNPRMDTKRKLIIVLGHMFEDKDYIFPPQPHDSSEA
jgi:transcriptional regulator with XRE-family HTH domain